MKNSENALNKQGTQASENPFLYSDSNKRYHTFDYFMRKKFGSKCCKIPIDGGFTCPNRDGTKGVGGCSFCSAHGSGDFTAGRAFSITEQFERGRETLSSKWKDALCIPYFQAFTNTYAPLCELREKYEEALRLPNVVGLNIATRADALPDDVVDYLRELSHRTFLTVELGLQSIHDKTAERLNRCHTYEEFLSGYKRLEGLNVCVHLINGLPGETPEMMMETAGEVAKLHPAFVKLHLLHVLKGTRLAEEYENGGFEVLSLTDYIKITVSQLELMPAETVIGRVTGDGPPDSLVAPLWSRKKFVVMNGIDKEFISRGTYQGFFV